jgi:hypothetical protein
MFHSTCITPATATHTIENTSLLPIIQVNFNVNVNTATSYCIASHQPTFKNTATHYTTEKKTRHRKHPNPTMSLATSRTASPSHLDNTNTRVLSTPKPFSSQKPASLFETALPNASEIPDPRTPQQAQDDGIYDYARSMRRVKQERHRDKQANDPKLGMDQFMFLLSRDAKEGEKSECDGVGSANDSDDEEDTESRGESKDDSIAEEEGTGELLREVWRQAPGLLSVVLVSLMLTVVFVACREHWLPMMGLRAMRWQ